MEVIVHRRLLGFINEYGISSSKQFGFQPPNNCLGALIMYTEFKHKVIDNHEEGQAFFVDI